jgi:4-hydroxy-4-methyl-2-oxoglutarate aldolase
VECGGVTVYPGDLIVGDANGVICVPRALIMPLLEACEAALAEERSTQLGLETGEGAWDLFARHGRF